MSKRAVHITNECDACDESIPWGLRFCDECREEAILLTSVLEDRYL